MAVTVTQTLSRQQRRRAERLARKQERRLENCNRQRPATLPAVYAPYGAIPDNPLSHTQLSIPAFGRLVSTLEGYGNRLAAEHKTALGLLCGIMTRMAAGELKGRYAFGLPTGMGKTSAIIAWLSKLTELGLDDIAVAVSASKVEALCELKRALINAGVPASKIGLVHSKRYDKEKVEEAKRTNAPLPDHYASEPSEPHDRQVMLVTHQRVRGCDPETFNTYQGRPRDLLIYDESLITADSQAIAINLFKAGISWLREAHGTKETVKETLRYLDSALEVITSAGPGQTVVRLPDIPEEHLLRYLASLPSQSILDPVRDLLNIAMYDVRVISDGQQGVVWYEIKVPKDIRNVLILDASTPIRRLVQLDRTIIDVEDEQRGLAEVRRLGFKLSRLKKFDQLTIHQMFQGGGRSTLEKSFRELRAEDRKISQEVVKVVEGVPEDEAVLVFTYKRQAGKTAVDFRQVLLDDLEDAGVDASAKLTDGIPRISILTWGSETSLNSYSHCQHVILAGVLQRSMIDLKAAFLGAVDDLHGEIPKGTIAELRRSEQAHMTYQALSRGSCRVIDNGHARRMTAYLIDKDGLLQKDLDRVFPGAVWREWKTTTGVNQGVISKLAKSIGDHLRGLPEETSKISTSRLRKVMEVSGEVPSRTWTHSVRDFVDQDGGWVLVGRSLVRNTGERFGFAKGEN